MNSVSVVIESTDDDGVLNYEVFADHSEAEAYFMRCAKENHDESDSAIGDYIVPNGRFGKEFDLAGYHVTLGRREVKS